MLDPLIGKQFGDQLFLECFVGGGASEVVQAVGVQQDLAELVDTFFAFFQSFF